MRARAPFSMSAPRVRPPRLLHLHSPPTTRCPRPPRHARPIPSPPRYCVLSPHPSRPASSSRALPRPSRAVTTCARSAPRRPRECADPLCAGTAILSRILLRRFAHPCRHACPAQRPPRGRTLPASPAPRFRRNQTTCIPYIRMRRCISLPYASFCPVAALRWPPSHYALPATRRCARSPLLYRVYAAPAPARPAHLDVGARAPPRRQASPPARRRSSTPILPRPPASFRAAAACHLPLLPPTMLRAAVPPLSSFAAPSCGLRPTLTLWRPRSSAYLPIHPSPVPSHRARHASTSSLDPHPLCLHLSLPRVLAFSPPTYLTHQSLYATLPSLYFHLSLT
ncbi:hypothetical protein DFH08DRAFT_1082837 [Mycena albidolilacea]|uniref:Uncharacterized protein n=1 Tax=Mycena albidolilacea TaxID=1033008 RepID=A0AAD7ENP1_9AGAR|nr:hypothetical protein DFH08DRAFT_1082837 [Mycena albidolilacea]